MDAPPPDPLLRRDLVREGWSDDELARSIRRGDLSRLRRGAYLSGPAPVDGAARHLLLVHATLRTLRRPGVVSHQSAAVLHGLPLWGTGLACAGHWTGPAGAVADAVPSRVYSKECSGAGKAPERTSSAYSRAARSSSPRRSA